MCYSHDKPSAANCSALMLPCLRTVHGPGTGITCNQTNFPHQPNDEGRVDSYNAVGYPVSVTCMIGRNFRVPTILVSIPVESENRKMFRIPRPYINDNPLFSFESLKTWGGPQSFSKSISRSRYSIAQLVRA